MHGWLRGARGGSNKRKAGEEESFNVYSETCDKERSCKKALAEAPQKHAGERSVLPLRDIQNRSASKCVSRRVRQEKLSTYYTPSNTMNTHTGPAILYREGDNKGVFTNPDNIVQGLCKSGNAYLSPLQAVKGNLVSSMPALKKKHHDSENLPQPLKRKKANNVFTESQALPLNLKKTEQLLPESQTRSLNPKKKPLISETQTTLDLALKKGITPANEPHTPRISKGPVVMQSVVEELSQPQTPETNHLSKHFKMKQGVPKLQLAVPMKNPITPQDVSYTLKPQVVSNKLMVRVEEHPLDQPPKLAIITPDRRRDSKCEIAQPLGVPYDRSSVCLNVLAGLVDSLDGTTQAGHRGSPNTNTAGLQDPVRQSPGPNIDNSVRPQDYYEHHIHSPDPMSSSPPPGAYDPTSPVSSIILTSPPAIYGDNSTAMDNSSKHSLEGVFSADTATNALGRSHWAPVPMLLQEHMLQNGVAAISAREVPDELQAAIQPCRVLIPNQLLYVYLKDIQIAVRRLKRQAYAALLKIELGNGSNMLKMEAQQKVLQMVQRCKTAILQACREAVADIRGILGIRARLGPRSPLMNPDASSVHKSQPKSKYSRTVHRVLTKSLCFLRLLKRKKYLEHFKQCPPVSRPTPETHKSAPCIQPIHMCRREHP